VARTVLEGLPRHHPALTTSQAIQKRLAAAGVELGDATTLAQRIGEEAASLATAADPEECTRRLAGLLFATAQLGRALGVDAEEALRQSNRRVVTSLREWEAARASTPPTPDDLQRWWRAHRP
jgi:uncharacterized protein YabN with tetrapyrrole methylase and pyrophosphatase domain